MKGKKPIDNLISLDSFDESNGDREYDTVLNEIAQFKRTIATTPIVSNYSEEAGNSQPKDASDGEIARLIALTEELLRTTKQANAKTAEEIAGLRARIEKLDAPATYSQCECSKSQEVSVCDTSVLRQLYVIEEMIGQSSPQKAKYSAELKQIYDALDLVHFNMSSEAVSMYDKLTGIDALAKMLVETEIYDVVPVVETLNAYLAVIEHMPLDKEKSESIIQFAENTEGVLIPSTKKELIRAYMSTVATKIRDGGVDCIDALPDVIALKNDIQHNKFEYENELKYSDVLNKNIMLLSERDIVKNKNLRAEIKDKINDLVSLEVKDLFVYPPIRIKKAYAAAKEVDSVTLSQKIDELKAYVADAVLQNVEKSSDGSVVISGIAAEINSLKKELQAISNTDGIKNAVNEINEKMRSDSSRRYNRSNWCRGNLY